MAWTKKQIMLALMLVFFGSINTISTKYADETIAENSEGEMVVFNHPFLQADGMFMGEMLCMCAFYTLFFKGKYDSKKKGTEAPVHPDFPPYVMYIPAFCDMLATSIMYLGLTLTYASSFQMLRGAVIVFTALFSVAFLGRKLRYFNWLGVAMIIVGLLLTGVADFLVSDDSLDSNGILTGDLLIIMAQIVTATQMVVEEKFVTGHNVPALLAVGWEGLFGFLTLSVLLVPMYFIPAGPFGLGNPRGVLEDALDGFVQLGNSWQLRLAIAGNILSIAFFNFAGISVTKELSATTRMVLDSVRTLVVWVYSLSVGWQKFIGVQFGIQFAGFFLLISGMFVYNDVVIFPFMRSQGWINDAIEDEEPIINQNTTEKGDVLTYENAVEENKSD